MQGKNLYKIAIEGLGITVCLLAFLSCLTFDIGDWPSGYVSPNNSPFHNICGKAGAFAAYYLLYYIGPGVFVVLASLIGFLVTSISGKKINQILLRVIGMLVVTTVVSSFVHFVYEFSEGGFPFGNGGVLGVATGNALKVYFALIGSAVILLCSFIVGSILLADSVVMAVLKYCGAGFLKLFGGVAPAVSAAKERSSVLGDIWAKLSAKQKAEAAKPRTFTISRKKDIELEEIAGEVEEEYEEYDEPVEEIDEEDEEEEYEEEEQEQPSGGAAKRLKITKRRRSKPKPYVQKTYDDYVLPPLELLEEPEDDFSDIQEDMVKECAQRLETLLHEFNINAHVVNAEPGPAITMYELELSAGIKVSQISSLNNDIARALGAQCVRIVAPIPGRHTVGIEVPNKQREVVRIRELINRAGKKPDKMKIPLFLGKDSSGEALVTDLASMPHGLIAGTTGSGKSVCINTIITSVLMTRRPDEVKLILVDPKMVEMVPFNNIPHLMCPIVTEMRKAEQILEWAVTKMDERYALLAEAGVRNISAYNSLGAEELIERFSPGTPEEEAKIPKTMPHVVIIVDELADLMMMSAKEVESYIVRIAQKSRAVGIHIILATQRPQATVVTGLIKSNLPCRVSFRVASRMDSRIILDSNGAETLLGQGDMLFLRPGTSDLVRAQGAYLDDNEIRKVVKHLKEVAEPQYHPELMQMNRINTDGMKQDELFDKAVRIVLETKRGSVSLLQRKLAIGYSRASRIIEMMASSGILGEYKGSQAREVMMTVEEWDNAMSEPDEYEDYGEEDEYEEYTEEDGGYDDDFDEEYEEYDSPVEEY